MSTKVGADPLDVDFGDLGIPWPTRTNPAPVLPGTIHPIGLPVLGLSTLCGVSSAACTASIGSMGPSCALPGTSMDSACSPMVASHIDAPIPEAGDTGVAIGTSAAAGAASAGCGPDEIETHDDCESLNSLLERKVDAVSDPPNTDGTTSAGRAFGQFGAADIRAAAGASDRGGLTRVGRALQKHSDRDGSVFGGRSSGNPNARNEQGMRVLDEILEDPGSTTQVLDNVTNIWDSTGRGIRLNNDGTFMGFLEPLP